MFSKKESQNLPPHSGHLDHYIPLDNGAKPIFGPIYDLSELELKVLKKYVDEQLKKFICLSISPFRLPILFIKKADRSLHLCIDYHALNRITIKNRYSLTLTTESMDRIKGVTYFTVLDVQNAFNHLCLEDRDEWKPTFYIRYDHFEYLVMSFRLCNTLMSFQSYINNALYEYL